MDYDGKRSGQIPAFGNWDYASDLPITQYFESAREAGLMRYSSSSGESNPYVRGGGDLYSVDAKKKTRRTISNVETTKGREKRYPQIKEHRKQQQQKQGKVSDVREPQSKQHSHHLQNDTVSPPRRHRISARPPKPVDEDLYKIPPELLHTTKRKKMLGFISRCLVPCTA